ncbi:hypothetical protein K435DRAFT_846662 [Dendrothele bispora CBS 962.96]|uniref:Uncharacterized protein n=1 Tax=Dendrothele bispora (strain CBS 962.96) TaxID=1314807 RepID=A0A4S8KL42_DENBC|nr:hypothetical protein K435DRAFT_846662 [Dendrothele bispora CBS 962.96]
MVTEWDPYIFLSGIHGYQWDPWVSSVGSVGFHGSHGIHGIYGLHGLLGGFLCKFPSGLPSGLPAGLPGECSGCPQTPTESYGFPRIPTRPTEPRIPTESHGEPRIAMDSFIDTVLVVVQVTHTLSNWLFVMTWCQGTPCPHLEGQFKSTGGHRVLETSTFFHFWDSWDLSDHHAFGSFFNRWQHGDEAQTSGQAVASCPTNPKFFAVDLAAKSGVSIQVWRISESGITAPIGRPLLYLYF